MAKFAIRGGWADERQKNEAADIQILTLAVDDNSRPAISVFELLPEQFAADPPDARRP